MNMSTLDSVFFAGNRERVYDQLKGGVLAMSAYTQMQRSNDIAFRFEQEASFWYLTGIEHPDWWLLMDGKRRRSWLVAPHVEDHHALFDGQLSHEQAARVSGVNDIIDRQSADAWLRQSARSHRLVYTIDHPPHSEMFGFTLNPAPRELREKLERTFAKVEDFRLELTKLRAIKQPLEIAMIQSAINLSVDTFADVHARLASLKSEYEVEAEFTAMFRKKNARHAYDPIVAGGVNACTLHYVDNGDVLKKGQLLLIDIGAKVDGYAADITRTYAVGSATKRQKYIHESLVNAQRQIIALLEPGLPIEEYHRRVDDIMQAALIDLKLIKDNSDVNYRMYFPHAISHGLGIDVHDALGRPRVFQPGMVLTVEPGIYIPKEKIGIRIEDDILITETGHKNLSTKLPTDL